MKLLVADDHPLYREAVVLRIRRLYPDAEVREVSSLPELRDVLAESKAAFDLVLVDFHMPGMSAPALVTLVDDLPDVPVAVVSGTAAHADIRAAIQAGVRGYIPKTSPADHFAHAMQMLLSGGSSIPVDLLRGDPEAKPAEPWLVALSNRERDVLMGVALGRSNKEIAREMNLAEVTIKLHLRNLFRKMAVKSRSEAAVKAVKAGLG